MAAFPKVDISAVMDNSTGRKHVRWTCFTCGEKWGLTDGRVPPSECLKCKAVAIEAARPKFEHLVAAEFPSDQSWELVAVVGAYKYFKRQMAKG